MNSHGLWLEMSSWLDVDVVLLPRSERKALKCPGSLPQLGTISIWHAEPGYVHTTPLTTMICLGIL